MKKIVLFVLALCLSFAAIGTALAETAAAEAPAAETPKAEMNAEELYQAGKAAKDAGDYEKAKEYLRPAADLGNTNAIHNLGNWYFYGLGAEQNVDEGLKYYRMAAEQGNPLSQCMLGSLYYYGMAVEQDYDKAFEYLPEVRAGGRVSAEIKQSGWLRHLPGHLKHRINTAGTLSQDGEQ